MCFSYTQILGTYKKEMYPWQDRYYKTSADNCTPFGWLLSKAN